MIIIIWWRLCWHHEYRQGYWCLVGAFKMGSQQKWNYVHGTVHLILSGWNDVCCCLLHFVLWFSPLGTFGLRTHPAHQPTIQQGCCQSESIENTGKPSRYSTAKGGGLTIFNHTACLPLIRCRFLTSTHCSMLYSYSAGRPQQVLLGQLATPAILLVITVLPLNLPEDSSWGVTDSSLGTEHARICITKFHVFMH